MKMPNIVFLGLAAMVLSVVATSRAEVNVNVNFNELNNYGEWVIVPGYGTVWRPDAGPDWRPFTYGHWVYTSDGWMWDSDEPFGWIVCHYGNWYFDDDQGWVWLPGYNWSPARVKWYVTDNEIGWAPLFPKARHGYHHNAIQMQWTFAPLPFFTSYEIHNHLAIRDTPAPGRARVHVYTGPPDRKFVQRHINTPITSIALNKVRITARERPLVRVEVQHGKRSNVEVPVGPNYRRVTVRNQPEPGKSVTITQERAVQPAARQEQFDNPRMRAEDRSIAPEGNARVRPRDDRENQDGNSVQPPARQEQSDNPHMRVETRSTAPEASARVQPRNNRENQSGNRNDNNQGKKKVKVEVRTR